MKLHKQSVDLTLVGINNFTDFCKRKKSIKKKKKKTSYKKDFLQEKIKKFDVNTTLDWMNSCHVC